MRSRSPGRAWNTAGSIALPLAGGAIVGLSLPPVGLWPLGIVGVALVVSALFGRSTRGRIGTGMLAGIGQFFISLAWALQFNVAGYVVLAIVEAAFYAAACVLVPRGRGRLPAVVAALSLAEWARQTWPFGGLPLGGIALGQAAGPIAPTARLGGSLLVAAVTFLTGASVAALIAPVLARRSNRAGPAGGRAGEEGAGEEGAGEEGAGEEGAGEEGAGEEGAGEEGAGRASVRGGGGAAGGSVAGGIAGLVVALALVLVARALPSPSTTPGGAKSPTIRVALVQGGGRRGLDQLEVPASVVFGAAVRATARVPAGVALILWPEDVVSLTRPLAGSPEEAVLASLARRHHATLVAGVTEPVGTTRFRNEVVAFAPSGRIVAEFEKVHRVPFGEYVPWRGFFSHFANLRDVPRDAVPGHGSGMIATPAGKFAVLVSYEVFFADRGRSGVRAGGEVVLVPTNTSSYSNDQAPSQEIAASRLQAVEEGRYVLLDAPTGYSAVIDPGGEVLEQTRLSEQAVLLASVPLLTGSTVFVDAGNLPVLAAALVALLGAWAAAFSRRESKRRHRRTSPSP